MIHPTFKAVCNTLDLQDDDRKWEICLQEAAISQTGYQLCSILLSFGTPFAMHCLMIFFHGIVMPSVLSSENYFQNCVQMLLDPLARPLEKPRQDFQ
jgi:hypothetical protein